jgi:UDP-N-acetylmuramate dehydrogenase
MPGYPVPGGVKVPAAWLIEQCGWKGRRFGPHGVHEHQALVLVNHGGAQGANIRDLAHEIIASVREKFGVELHPEVNIM